MLKLECITAVHACDNNCLGSSQPRAFLSFPNSQSLHTSQEYSPAHTSAPALKNESSSCRYSVMACGCSSNANACGKLSSSPAPSVSGYQSTICALQYFRFFHPVSGSWTRQGPRENMHSWLQGSIYRHLVAQAACQEDKSLTSIVLGIFRPEESCHGMEEALDI